MENTVLSKKIWKWLASLGSMSSINVWLGYFQELPSSSIFVLNHTPSLKLFTYLLFNNSINVQVWDWNHIWDWEKKENENLTRYNWSKEGDPKIVSTYVDDLEPLEAHATMTVGGTKYKGNNRKIFQMKEK